MGVVELALSVVIAAAAAVGSGVPFSAWMRTREPRLLLVGGADLALLLVGLVWLWGQLPVSPPSYTATTLPAAALVALAALLLLGTGLVRRRA